MEQLEHRHHPPGQEHPQHHSLDADIIGKIFPCGYSIEVEHNARSIATKIGYGVLCNLDNGVTEEVPIDRIHPCQRILNKTKVIELILYLRDNEVPGYPMGMKIGDDFYLLDGHHRVSAQILMGKKKIMMHCMDMTDYEKILAQQPPRERHQHRPPILPENTEIPRP